MIENFVLVLVLILIGSISRKVGWLPENSANILNSFVLNISLPAMILVSVPSLKVDSAILYPISFHWVLYAINIGLVILVSKALKFKKSVLGVLLVVSCMGNTAFLGIPMNASFFGESAVPYAVLFDQLGSGFAFILTAAFILPIFTHGEKSSLVDIFKNLIKFPPFVALVLAFFLMKFPLPSILNDVVIQVSKTLIPCAMIAVGYQMKYKLSLSELKPLVAGLGIKLLLIPVLALIAGNFIPDKHLSLNVSIIQSGMPPMITAGAMAMQENLESDIAAALVGYGLFFSFLTIPFIKYFL